MGTSPLLPQESPGDWMTVLGLGAKYFICSLISLAYWFFITIVFETGS